MMTRRDDDDPRRDGIYPSSLPPWARALAIVGLPGFIALYLLGAIPGLPSPIHELRESLAALASAQTAHFNQSQQAIRLQRLICRGVWRGQPDVQSQCGGQINGVVE